MKNQWIISGEGKSIGQQGSEGGRIIRDEETTMGARVTLEDQGDIAPFSITLGIYGLMFHTEFFSTFEQGHKCFDLYKEKIEQILNHNLIGEEKRDFSWNMQHNKLMDEILHIC
jgi:hypothetical protein